MQLVVTEAATGVWPETPAEWKALERAAAQQRRRLTGAWRIERMLSIWFVTLTVHADE
jgi:hypothetical protein